MWLIARGAMSDAAAQAHADAPLLSRAGVEHGGRPPHPGEPSNDRPSRSPSPAPAPSASSTSTAIKNIDGVEVVSLVSRELDKTREVADKYGIGHVTTDLADSLALTEVDAVILCTPTQMHAEQTHRLPEGRQARAGRDPAGRQPGRTPRRWSTLQKQTGLVAMCGHTRRFNPSHQCVHKKIVAGEFNIQQMDVQTYFFRRTNMNALGQARSWTDHLLWHHAAHTVDLFAYQTGGPIVQANAVQGPIHPDARHRDGHVDPAAGRQRRDLHAVALASTTTARSAPSSATSATPAPTSPATTTCSTARTSRSTCRRSTCR